MDVLRLGIVLLCGVNWSLSRPNLLNIEKEVFLNKRFAKISDWNSESEENWLPSNESRKYEINEEASKSYSCTNFYRCIRFDLLSIIDHLNSITSIPIVDKSITLVKNGDESREDVDKDDLEERIDRFLRCRSIRFRLPTWDVEAGTTGVGDRSLDVELGELQPSSSEGRRRKRKGLRKYLLPAILVIALKFAALLPMFLSGLALLSVTGLMSGAAALFASTVLGLRALFLRDGGVAVPTSRLAAVVRPNIFPVETVVHAGYIPTWARRDGGEERPFRNYPLASKQ